MPTPYPSSGDSSDDLDSIPGNVTEAVPMPILCFSPRDLSDDLSSDALWASKPDLDSAAELTSRIELCTDPCTRASPSSSRSFTTPFGNNSATNSFDADELRRGLAGNQPRSDVNTPTVTVAHPSGFNSYSSSTSQSLAGTPSCSDTDSGIDRWSDESSASSSSTGFACQMGSPGPADRSRAPADDGDSDHFVLADDTAPGPGSDPPTLRAQSTGGLRSVSTPEPSDIDTEPSQDGRRSAPVRSRHRSRSSQATNPGGERYETNPSASPQEDRRQSQLPSFLEHHAEHRVLVCTQHQTAVGPNRITVVRRMQRYYSIKTAAA